MKNRKPLELIFGIILLIPPLLSVVGFLLRFIKNVNIFGDIENTRVWFGYILENGGLASPLPLYFGLMGIAGALLIINSYKKQDTGNRD